MIFTIISDNTPAEGINIVPFLGEKGVKWTANGIDSSDAGRTQDLRMQRGLLGYKAKCNVSCLWMDKADTVPLLQAIMPEYITVITDTIPWIDDTVVLEMYSNNIGATCLTEYTDGNKLYGDVEFPIVER